VQEKEPNEPHSRTAVPFPLSDRLGRTLFPSPTVTRGEGNAPVRELAGSGLTREGRGVWSSRRDKDDHRGGLRKRKERRESHRMFGPAAPSSSSTL